MNFNPPAPCGAGLKGKELVRQRIEFQSTRPVWGGTKQIVVQQHIVVISIHPPRVGRDDVIGGVALDTTDFNPPAPCGAGRMLRLPGER